MDRSMSTMASIVEYIYMLQSQNRSMDKEIDDLRNWGRDDKLKIKDLTQKIEALDEVNKELASLINKNSKEELKCLDE